MAYIVFNKKPNKKNLKNRSVCFQLREIEEISPDDQVKIIVHSDTSPLIEINISGRDLLKSLVSTGSQNYKVFNF